MYVAKQWCLKIKGLHSQKERKNGYQALLLVLVRPLGSLVIVSLLIWGISSKEVRQDSHRMKNEDNNACHYTLWLPGYKNIPFCEGLLHKQANQTSFKE